MVKVVVLDLPESQGSLYYMHYIYHMRNILHYILI